MTRKTPARIQYIDGQWKLYFDEDFYMERYRGRFFWNIGDCGTVLLMAPELRKDKINRCYVNFEFREYIDIPKKPRWRRLLEAWRG